MSDPASDGGDARKSVSSSVEVDVDPDTAFAAFTEELDLWWVRGPINYHAAGRAVAMRCESQVGGRLLEVYDDATDDALELARITVWEPGKRLAWQSSIDDVETEVRFQASGSGTVVKVTVVVPAGGHDRGGTAWVRVVPKWYGAWCARRDIAPREVRDIARLALAVTYAKPAAAARWLAASFGFESDELPAGTDPLAKGEHGHPWIEFRVGDSSLMIFKRDEKAGEGSPSHIPWVYVDDVDTHFRGACSSGATIIEPLASPWGLPLYTAADPEGNHWTFVQARPTMP
jgi:uncharacterized glyoxalase superfamily protein PhnB